MTEELNQANRWRADAEAKLIAANDTIATLRAKLADSEATVKDLRVRLSGKTMYCEACQEMAAKLAEAERENAELQAIKEQFAKEAELGSMEVERLRGILRTPEWVAVAELDDALTQSRADLEAETTEARFNSDRAQRMSALYDQARADLEEEKRRRALDIAAFHRARRWAERAEAALREVIANSHNISPAAQIARAYFTQQSPQGQKDDK